VPCTRVRTRIVVPWTNALSASTPSAVRAATGPHDHNQPGSRNLSQNHIIWRPTRIPVELVTLIEGLALRRPPPKIAQVHREAVRIAAEKGWSAPSYPVVYRIVADLDRGLVSLVHKGAAAYRNDFDLDQLQSAVTRAGDRNRCRRQPTTKIKIASIGDRSMGRRCRSTTTRFLTKSRRALCPAGRSAKSTSVVVSLGCGWRRLVRWVARRRIGRRMC